MANLKEIAQEIEELMSMKALVTTYEEISSMKMRKLRSNVLTNRNFINELTQIYQELVSSYREQFMALLKGKKRKIKDQNTIRESNEKVACVFLSANSGLFGKILHKTFREFDNYTNKNNAEPVIIGEFGKRLFEQKYPGKHYKYFPLPDTGNNEGFFRKIMEDLLTYKNVVVFFAKFESMASQNVALLDFSGQQRERTETGTPIYYIFEPSLEKILDFFEKQIFSTILDQTFTESDLARNAERMIVLDAAMDNIGTRLKSFDLQKKIAIHRSLNKKQVESLSSISLWGVK